MQNNLSLFSQFFIMTPVVWVEWKYEIKSCYIFQLGQSQRIVVFHFELHKAHVGWMCELRDDAKSWKKSGKKKKHRLSQ